MEYIRIIYADKIPHKKTLTMIAANFWTLKMLVPGDPKIYAAKIIRGKTTFAGSMSETTFLQRFSS